MLNSLKVCHNQLLFFTQNNYMENYSHCCVYLYFIPFLLLSSIQWDEYTTVCLSSHSLKDIWSGLVPILSFYFWLLKLLWTSICKSLWGLMFLFLLDKYLWMELLGHMLILCLILWGTTQLFAKVVTQFYIPTSSIWECQFLYIFANTYYYILLVITILVSMKCYLVIFIDFSLMANDGDEQRLITLYRRQGTRPSPRKRNGKGKILVRRGLTNSCEKTWNTKEKRKDTPIGMQNSKE